MPPDSKLALALYRQMCLLRSFDVAGAAAYGRKEIHGTYRGAKGQEAIPVGVCATPMGKRFLTASDFGSNTTTSAVSSLFT